MYKRFGKRTIDLIAALLLTLLLLVPGLLISIIIMIDSPGPILFRQTRIGKNQVPFSIFKFRTMGVNTDPYLSTRMNHTGRSKCEITRFGRVLRRTSIDELPQLLNILIGNMSFIGPRPVIANEHELLELRFGVANQVLPGITGTAQISGRDNLTDSDKAKFDNLYANHLSMKTDFAILCKTIIYVLVGTDNSDNWHSRKSD